MKAVDFGKLAAAAEVQRLERMGLRYARRAAFLVVAGLFGLFALISAHVLLWVLCYGPWNTGKVWASVIVLGADLLLAILCVVLGRGRKPSISEFQARVTRDENLAAMRSSLALNAVSSTVMGPAGRMAGRGIVELFRGRARRRRDRRRVR